MSEKAKMLAGALYNAADPELIAERRRAQFLLACYNATGPDESETRSALSRELLGAVGDRADIQPRFCCDYGYNIRLGRRAFINYNCVFLDCAPIEIGDDL
jgi:maltose O-acetyltransferase